MQAYDIKIEWDEDGCHLIIDGDSPDPEYTASIVDYRVEDPEQLYDRVKAAILPWLMERDEAFAEFRQYAERGTGPAAEYFACKDPESDWAEMMRDNADHSRKVAKGE